MVHVGTLFAAVIIGKGWRLPRTTSGDFVATHGEKVATHMAIRRQDGLRKP